MPAAIVSDELQDGLLLLARRDGDAVGLSVAGLKIAAVRVQGIFRIDQVPMVLQQPVDAVLVAVELFVRRERQHQIPRRDPTFLLRADEVRDRDRGGSLHVLGAAPVEVSVALDELERIEIGRPVLFRRLDHVQVPENQDGFGLAAAVQARDDILLARRRPDHLDVGFGKPRRAQSLRHGLRRRRRADAGVRRLDLDQLSEYLTRERPVVARGRSLRPGRQWGEARNQTEDYEQRTVLLSHRPLHAVSLTLPGQVRSLAR